MSRVCATLICLAVALSSAVATGETAGTAVEIDTSDWDWGAAAPEGVTVPAREPAVTPDGDTPQTAGEEAVAKTGALPDEGGNSAPAEAAARAEETAPVEETAGAAQEAAAGWDWDAFAPMDDSPTVRKRQVTKRETDRMDEFLTGPRVGKTAEPDFSGDIQPAYALFPDAPAFAVIPSVRDRDMHPCSNCHTWTKSDLTPRKLKKPHDNFELKHGLHGKGKFWCFTCHTLDGRGGLRTLEGQKLDFNEAYVLCSQCHVQETRDWVFGAHGKRVANWQGERQVYNCTVCHYQHDPAIEPRAALAGPVVRQGLERPDHWTTATSAESDVFETGRVWERYAGADRGDRR